MTGQSVRDEDPFEDPQSEGPTIMQAPDNDLAGATLSVGRDASLTISKDSLVITGQLSGRR